MPSRSIKANDQKPKTALIRLGFDLRHVLSDGFFRCRWLLPRARSQHFFHADVFSSSIFRYTDVDLARSLARRRISFGLLRRSCSRGQVSDLLVGHELSAFGDRIRDLRSKE